jgi:hypothetical protein
MGNRSWMMSRRAVLHGVGATLALPLLEAMIPVGPAAAQTAPAAIKRFVAVYFPHGMMPALFWPSGSGTTFTLSAMMASLNPYKQDLSVLRGFANRPGGVHPAGTDEGNGIHARHTGSFLTASALKPTQASEGRDNEANAGNGMSVDQVIAQAQTGNSCLPSLVLGARGGQPNSEGEDQFGAVYMNNISWTGGNKYVPKEVNPLNLYNRLTGCPVKLPGGTGGGVDASVAAQRKLECSVMSSVNEQAKALMNKVGKADRETLDKFYTSVDELGRRCQASANDGAPPAGSTTQCVPPAKPGAAETTYQSDLRLMMDLAVFAMQCDLTRVASLMIAGAFEFRNFTFAGAGATNPHDMTHNAAQNANWAKVTTWTMEQYAYLLGKMKAVGEGGATLLDNSIVYLGSEFGDGSSHDETNVACVVAGKAGGLYKPGKFLSFNETPRANLYLEFIQAMGGTAAKFGDSTAPYAGLRG